MNTEKIEKLKKGLNNSQISDSIKAKIREQIDRLEKEDLETTDIVVKDEEIVVVVPKEEEPVAKVRKPRTKKEVVVPVEKPVKRTVLVVAKEIREEGESWAKARERASKLINKSKEKVEEKSKKELDKLLKYIASRKELDGISGKNLLRDAKRNAKQLGRRTVTHTGETSNQYGTFENHLGRTYHENRDGHGDRLSKSHRKGMPYLEGGGDLKNLKIGDIVANTRSNNIGIVRDVFNDGGGDVRTDADGVVSISELEMYNPEKHKDFHIAPSTKKEIGDKYENGGDFMAGVYSEGGGDLKNLKIGDIVANTRSNNIGIVRDVFNDGGGDVRTDADGVVSISELEIYNPERHKDYHIAPSTKKEIGDKYENGGDFMAGVYSEGGAMYAPHADNPKKYLQLLGIGDAYETPHFTKSGIKYYVGRKRDKAFVVSLIENDEDKSIIDKKDLLEMSKRANLLDVDVVELNTNHKVALNKPILVGFDKIYKVTNKLENGGNVNYDYEKGKNYPVKTISVADGEKVSISDYPNFSKTGSISGMKKQYYGKDALLVKCGSYIYNVTSNPSIYFDNSYENGGDFMNGVYADGGNIAEKKTFSLDFYTKKTDKQPYYDDKIVKAYSVKDVIEKAKKTAKLEEFEYVEIYHNKHFVGSISRDKGFDFVEGNGYDDYIAENETPEIFENEHGVRVQSKVAPEKKVPIADWMGKTNSSREAMSYADGGEFISSADSIKKEVKGKSQQERIDHLIEKIKKHRWSSKPITEDMGIVKTFANIYDLEPERVASLFNKHQKTSYANGGSITSGIVNLVPLELVPLSTQFSRFTGDALASGVYVDENGKDYKVSENAIIVHKESGQKFRIPVKIYDYVDTYNLVKSKSGKEIVVYETNAKVADIIDGKLDFSNKDESIVLDKNKLVLAFEKGYIPSARNADDEYMKIERELNRLYSLYEDNEDDEPVKNEINKEIKFLEDITHRLERKYAVGGTIEGKNKVIGQTSSGKNVYDDVFEFDKIYKDFTSQDHLDASNIYMETELSDLPMSRRDEYSAGHYRQTDAYKADLAERKAKRADKKALGGTIIGFEDPMLQGVVDIDNTGLVGETNAMSSGEMFAKGGSVSNTDRYIKEISDKTKLSKYSITKFVKENNLSDDHLLNVITGLGRGLIKTTDVVTAIVGDKDNSYSKDLIEFAKSGKAFKLADGGSIVAKKKRTPTESNTKMQKATAYAKANRKEGQTWREAMKEAFSKV